MPTYNVSAMADRIKYLQQDRGISETEARDQVLSDMGLDNADLPTEVQDQLTKQLAEPTTNNEFARNDKDSIVNRSEVPTSYDLGQERTDLTPQQEAPTEPTDSF
jgi:hypothetical protein